MTADEIWTMETLTELFDIFERADLCDAYNEKIEHRPSPGSGLVWRTNPLRFIVNCNTLFWWGTADAEEVMPADLPLLHRCLADLKAIDDGMDGELAALHMDWLYAARRRGMRPQSPCWKHMGDYPGLLDLFLAAGPQRDRKDEG